MRKVLLLGACLALAGSSVISQEVLRIGAIHFCSGSLAPWGDELARRYPLAVD